MLAIYSILQVIVLSCGTLFLRAETGTDTAIQSIVYIKRSFALKNGILEPTFTISERAWYCDSMGVTELVNVSVRGEGADGKVQVQEAKVVGYRFVDLRRRWAYEFTGLLDTLSVVKQFRLSNRTQLRNGWNFGNTDQGTLGTFSPITDTTITGISYKRYLASAHFGNMNLTSQLLFRCDLGMPAFNFDQHLTTRIGCPLSIMYNLSPSDKTIRSSTEIEYHTDAPETSLSTAFLLWRQYETMHPMVGAN